MNVITGYVESALKLKTFVIKLSVESSFHASTKKKKQSTKEKQAHPQFNKENPLSPGIKKKR